MNGLLKAPDLVLTALVIVVSIYDVRDRRIPNFLVFPGALLGLGFNAWLRGGPGFGYGLKGLAVGFFLLILPYAVGGMKAGDVKFLSAIGAFTGSTGVVRVLLATLLCYPVLAAVAVFREKKLRLTWLRFRRVLFNFLGVFLPPMRMYATALEGQDDPGVASVTTPFGVAIAAGTLIALYTNFLR